jgi:hypothetical protein
MVRTSSWNDNIVVLLNYYYTAFVTAFKKRPQRIRDAGSAANLHRFRLLLSTRPDAEYWEAALLLNPMTGKEIPGSYSDQQT